MAKTTILKKAVVKKPAAANGKKAPSVARPAAKPAAKPAGKPTPKGPPSPVKHPPTPAARPKPKAAKPSKPPPPPAKPGSANGVKTSKPAAANGVKSAKTAAATVSAPAVTAKSAAPAAKPAAAAPKQVPAAPAAVSSPPPSASAPASSAPSFSKPPPANRINAVGGALSISAQSSPGSAANGNTHPANILALVTSGGWPIVDLSKDHFTLMEHFEVPGQQSPLSNNIVSFRNAGTGAYLLQVKPINGAPWRSGHHLVQLLVSSPADLQGQVAVKLIIR